jgi:hypothetical protein
LSLLGRDQLLEDSESFLDRRACEIHERSVLRDAVELTVCNSDIRRRDHRGAQRRIRSS